MALPTNGLTLRLECLGRSNFTLDVNDKVEAWIDQATYGNFVQPTEDKRPEYFDDIDGSGPILRFGDSGASHWLQNLSPVSNLMNTAETAGNGTEVFIVARPIAYGTAYNNTANILTSSPAMGLQSYFQGASPACQMNVTCGGYANWQTTQVFNCHKDKMIFGHGRVRYTDNLKFKAMCRGGVSRGHYRETAEITQANPAVFTATGRIGTYGGAETYKLQAYIKCILVFNRLLTTDERNAVDDYLKTTYSLRRPAFFIDQVNGDDANDGTKMSTAKKTMQAAWAARGDTGESITFIRRDTTDSITAHNNPTRMGLPSAWHTFSAWCRPEITGITADFTNNSIAVTNVSGVTLSALAHEARRVLAPDGKTYVIGRVIDGTSFNLHTAYKGTTSTGGTCSIREDYDYDFANNLTAFEGADQKAAWDSDSLNVPTITTAGVYYLYYNTPNNNIKHIRFLNGNGSLAGMYPTVPINLFGTIISQETNSKAPIALLYPMLLQDCIIRASQSNVVLYMYSTIEIKLFRVAAYSLQGTQAYLIYLNGSISQYKNMVPFEDCGLGVDGTEVTNLLQMANTAHNLFNVMWSFINCSYRYTNNPVAHNEAVYGNSTNRLVFQNHNGVEGWVYVYQPKFGVFQTNTGDANITLPSGRDWVLEVLPNLQSGVSYPTRDRFYYDPGIETTIGNPLFEWRTSLKNQAKTLKVYVSAEEGICRCDLWLEATYYKNGEYRVIQSQQAITARSGVSDWSQYLSVTVDSDESTPVQVRLFCSHYSSEDKKFYVDPLIQEIGLQAVFAGTDAYVQGKVPVSTDIWPSIREITPSYGSSDGASIVCYGQGFTGASGLFFGSTSGTITSFSDTVLSGNAPSLVAGRYDVQIHSTLGVAGLSGGFTAVATERKITSITKSIGDIDGYMVVRLYSAEGLFLNASGVSFEGTPAVSFNVIDAYNIDAVVPKISPEFYTIEVA